MQHIPLVNHGAVFALRALMALWEIDDFQFLVIKPGRLDGWRCKPFVTVIGDPSSRIYSMFFIFFNSCKSRSRRFSQNVRIFAEKLKIQLPKFYPWRGFGSHI